MRKSHRRLTLTLLLASIGHVVFLYPTPGLIPIPLKEPTYSVEVQLKSNSASQNSREAAEQKNKDQLKSIASEASKAENDYLTESKTKKEQTGVKDAHIRNQASASNVKITSPKAAKKNADEKTDHHFNTHTKQKRDSTPKEVRGNEDSDILKTEDVVLTRDDVKVADITASKEKAQSKENSEASNQKSVKSEKAIVQPELTATERYELQVQAWIISKSSFSITSELKQAPTITATWWRNGTVIFATVKRSSGNPEADEAAKRNVLSASPLPKIPDHILGKEYTMDITLFYFDQ